MAKRKKVQQHIWVTASFAAHHRWTNAPEDVSFLRDYHRHVFHVRMTMLVSHGDRALEFFQVKRRLESYLSACYTARYFEKSCEMIAKEILTNFNATQVSVSEDNENGGLATSI